METYSKREFLQNGIKANFVQSNHSCSSRGVLRGLHFQKGRFAQDKLVRVVRGRAFDVAVDLRPDSKTFGGWQGVELSENNRQLFFIPKGFAHGFLALTKLVDLEYQVSNPYRPDSEGGVVWNDRSLNIAWPQTKTLMVSEKDQKLPFFEEIKIDLSW